LVEQRDRDIDDDAILAESAGRVFEYAIAWFGPAGDDGRLIDGPNATRAQSMFDFLSYS
jgi:hypothetical protein